MREMRRYPQGGRLSRGTPPASFRYRLTQHTATPQPLANPGVAYPEGVSGEPVLPSMRCTYILPGNRQRHTRCEGQMTATITPGKITHGPLRLLPGLDAQAYGFRHNSLILPGHGLALGYVALGVAAVSADGVTYPAAEGQWFAAPARDLVAITGAAVGVAVWYPGAIGVQAAGRAQLPEGFDQALLTAGLTAAGPDRRTAKAAVLTLTKAGHPAPTDGLALVLNLGDRLLRFSGANA